MELVQLNLINQKITGSTYEYYVKGLDGDREFTSDTKSATITTGVMLPISISSVSPLLS